MEVRWFGTAVVRITHGNKSIVFDPFVARNAKLKHVSAEELAGMGNIFLTHGHFDHAMDIPLLTTLGNSQVFCAPGTRELLIKEGVATERITAIQPGDRIEDGPFIIRVLAGEHSIPDRALVLQTFVSRRFLRHIRAFPALLKAHRRYEMGQVLTYQIEADGKTIFHMGSLNLSPEEEYPQGVDLMTLPFQGRSDLDSYALQFVERVRPQELFLHHYDDTFPPISNQISTTSFAAALSKRFPSIGVIIPEYREMYSL